MKIEVNIFQLVMFDGFMPLDSGEFSTLEELQEWLSDSGIKGRDLLIKIDGVPFIDTREIRTTEEDRTPRL